MHSRRHAAGLLAAGCRAIDDFFSSKPDWWSSWPAESSGGRDVQFVMQLKGLGIVTDRMMCPPELSQHARRQSVPM